MSHDPPFIDLTEDEKRDVRAILAMGCDRQTAAGFVGRGLLDLRRAMQHDPTFAASVKRAEAEIELTHMTNVRVAAKEPRYWRTSVWWLERRAPERFARSAGVITARQLKAFLAVLGDMMGAGDGPLDREQTVARLNAFAESLDHLLLDDCAVDAAHSEPLASPGMSAAERGSATSGSGDETTAADDGEEFDE